MKQLAKRWIIPLMKSLSYQNNKAELNRFLADFYLIFKEAVNIN